MTLIEATSICGRFKIEICFKPRSIDTNIIIINVELQILYSWRDSKSQMFLKDNGAKTIALNFFLDEPERILIHNGIVILPKPWNTKLKML
jgi:hypothetical protein